MIAKSYLGPASSFSHYYFIIKREPPFSLLGKDVSPTTPKTTTWIATWPIGLWPQVIRAFFKPFKNSLCQNGWVEAIHMFAHTELSSTTAHQDTILCQTIMLGTFWGPPKQPSPGISKIHCAKMEGPDGCSRRRLSSTTSHQDWFSNQAILNPLYYGASRINFPGFKNVLIQNGGTETNLYQMFARSLATSTSHQDTILCQTIMYLLNMGPPQYPSPGISKIHCAKMEGQKTTWTRWLLAQDCPPPPTKISFQARHFFTPFISGLP